MSAKKVLVTGGAGFIGSHLVDQLVSMDYEVLVIDNLSLGVRENINPRAYFWNEDIRDLEAIKYVFRGVDCVFHCAAISRIQPCIKNPEESFTNNLLGTSNVLEAARLAGVKKVVYSGSSSVYGDQKVLPLREEEPPRPKNIYAVHKLMSEQLCLKFTELYGLSAVCLRYFNVYGERQPLEGAYAAVVGIFLGQKERGEPLTIVGDGKQRRDFTYVGDVVKANLAAMDCAEAIGEVINIGTGINYSINELADLVEANARFHRCYLPARPGEAQESLADNSKAKKILSFKPAMSLSVWIKSQIKKMNL